MAGTSWAPSCDISTFAQCDISTLLRHGPELQPGPIACSDERDQVAACGLSGDRDSLQIHLVLAGMRLHITNRALDILHRRREVVGRGEAVVDRKPGKAGIGERLE